MRDKSWSDELARKVYVGILELMTKPAPKPVADKAAMSSDTPALISGDTILIPLSGLCRSFPITTAR